MAYPKPLSPKSLERLYRQSKLSEKQIEFLRKFVLACVNLYGAFFADEAWEVYKELSKKTDVIKIKRKNLYDMLEIMRREPDNSFYVFEIDEVYRDEKRRPGDMVIAKKELIGAGYYKFAVLQNLLDNSHGKPFFVPENLLEYIEMPVNPYETRLLQELENLKSTEKTVKEPIFGNKKKCKYTGKYLKDFSYVSLHDQFEIEWAEGKYDNKPNPKKVAQIKDKLYSVNAAQRLINDFKWDSNTGFKRAIEPIDEMMMNLQDMGVNMDDVDEMDHILQLASNMHNNQHLWLNHGWTPEEMMKLYSPIKNPVVSIGPGLEKAFEEGVIDKEEYLKTMHDLGFKVLDEDL